MKLSHLDALRPICPVCRKGEVFLARTISGSEGEVEEGLLECRACRHIYPVIDGIPLLVRDLRRVVSDQILSILARSDLSETTLQALGECCGSGSAFDATRQHLSMYLHGHWEDGAIARVLRAGLEKAGPFEGPVVDLGCSVGRTTLELASRSLVVGVDLNFAMVRAARRLLREGRLVYARRENGLVYEERTIEVDRAHAERADFWCADAMALPFASGTFGLATSLNLLDVVPSPLEHLRSVSELLRGGGAAIVASPFDWAPTATPVEQWLGGHTPLSKERGRPEEILAGLVGSPQLPALRIEAALDGLEWAVRLHARSEMRYRVALRVLRKLTLPS